MRPDGFETCGKTNNIKKKYAFYVLLIQDFYIFDLCKYFSIVYVTKISTMVLLSLRKFEELKITYSK